MTQQRLTVHISQKKKSKELSVIHREKGSFSLQVCVTIGLQWRASAAEPHDDGSESEASLHAVLPDALQDVQRKMDVQVTQEHDAVTILGRGGENRRVNDMETV